MNFIRNFLNKTKLRVRGASTLIKELFKSPLSTVNPDDRDVVSAVYAMVITTFIITILSFFTMFIYMKGDVSGEALSSVFKSQPTIYIPMYFTMMSMAYVLSFSLVVGGLKMKDGKLRLFKVVLFQLPRIHIVTTILYFLSAAINTPGSMFFFIVLISLYLLIELLLSIFETFEETRLRILLILMFNVTFCLIFYKYVVPWLLRI